MLGPGQVAIALAGLPSLLPIADPDGARTSSQTILVGTGENWTAGPVQVPGIQLGGSGVFLCCLVVPVGRCSGSGGAGHNRQQVAMLFLTGRHSRFFEIRFEDDVGRSAEAYGMALHHRAR